MQNQSHTSASQSEHSPYQGETEGGLKSLSIRISTDGLSFCVYAPTEAQPYTYKTYKVSPLMSMAANLKEALSTEPILQVAYQRVNILVSTPLYTTVPAIAFDRDHVAETFKFVFPKAEPCHVSYNVLRRSGIAIIFGLDKNVYQQLLDAFPRARFYASASTLIEFFSEKSIIGTGRKTFVYLHEEEMNLYAFDQGRMLFTNSYTVHSIDDCQYFILNMWKQLHLHQLDDSIYVVDDDSDMSHQLVDKIRYFIKQATLIERTEDFRETITHGNHFIPYDLQTLLICGF